jgi:hypothetical protein
MLLEDGALLSQELDPQARRPSSSETPAHCPVRANMATVGSLLDRVCNIPVLREFPLTLLIDLFRNCRWLAWTCDAIDFFSVALTVPLLQIQFDKPKASTIVRIRSSFVEIQDC